jgi:glycosyltransferase involved in cell wall biosynthesis
MAPRIAEALHMSSRMDDDRSAQGSDVDLTVLMPCLNEAETIGTCIREANIGIASLGLRGEILVADNGSNDGSQRIAEGLGARVVHVDEKGYGAALNCGIAAARGRWVIMGDADASYDFSQQTAFVEALRSGAELVIGNRFRGGIHRGAMPFLHRYLGNPVLSFLGRRFFGIPIRDFHCGLRAFERSAILELGLTTSGMEFASEMIVKAALRGYRVIEVPTQLRQDGRSRPPHLRTWRDGWRHLRFLLVYSPRYLFLLPGLLITAGASVASAVLLLSPRKIGAISLDIHTLLFVCGALFVGVQFTFFAVFAKAFGMNTGLLPPDQQVERAFKAITLESGLVVGGVLLMAGLWLSVAALLEWRGASFGSLDPSRTMRVAIPAVFCVMLGFQTVLGSFLLSLLGLRRRGHR